jgi:hypothetical protein
MLEGRTGRSWWERQSRVIKVTTVLTIGAALAVTGLLQARQWLAEREQAQLISLGTSLRVWASSTSNLSGGQVVYYVSIRNSGSERLEITSIRSSDEHLQLRARNDEAHLIDPGSEIMVPMSALLTCTDSPPRSRGLEVDVGLRRDGATLDPHHASLEGAAPLLDVVETLCDVWPGLRAYELSGPVSSASSAAGGGD